jgi:hypothetical protein
MQFSVILKYLTLAVLVMTCGNVLALESKPQVTVDGLHLVRESGFSLVYALPDIDLTQYNKIYLDDAYIAFKKNWKEKQNSTDSNRISANDMAKIKIELITLFREVFSQTLEQNGYELATDAAEDVLRITPAIINLDIVSPDAKTENGVYTYAASAGEMTLYLELYDSLSGDIIAKAVDAKKDRQGGYIQWQKRINNRAAALRILQVWANTLKEGLDAAGLPTKPVESP